MSKIIPAHDVAVPIPPADPARNWDPANPGNTHLILYYGAKGFTPAYAPVAPAGRIDTAVPLSSFLTKVVNGANCWDVPVGAQLPTSLPSGPYDFYFTLMYPSGNESDFNPVLTVSLDDTVPPTLGQPVLL